jgi:RsiW-degrading membrane proteinase PrsW (M82 family)
MVILTVPLIVCLIGLVIYFVCSKPTSNPELKEVAKIMFAAGLLVSLFLVGNEWARLTH